MVAERLCGRWGDGAEAETWRASALGLGGRLYRAVGETSRAGAADLWLAQAVSGALVSIGGRGLATNHP